MDNPASIQFLGCSPMFKTSNRDDDPSNCDHQVNDPALLARCIDFCTKSTSETTELLQIALNDDG
ncbi:hypothetical protein HK102_007130, partial [Quaeritorhiza haematococci]